ncbi:MAG TPA: L-2-hydroxyglutarate oxidase [Bacteroidia bacterium]|nr:L-2-hydroxyglutarate oxidase [Bacteroidia bacterium]HNT80484.1 L-2-hydroxyglutarate oxidase [Bacteroidia bacterium]
MSTETTYDIAIIGAGIVGLSSAYKISLRFPHLSILVLDKESEVSFHQTGRNSGVIHSGLYYKPGSYKAKNCVEGRRELVDFAKKHKVTHDVCGKVIVATDKAELPHMNKVFNNGLQNGVEGIEKINSDRIKDIEPFCRGLEGIWVPCTGIIDFKAVCITLKELVIANGQGKNQIQLSTEVLSVDKNSERINLICSNGVYHAKNIINCSGLQSDRVALMDKVNPDSKIVGFRGDYYELSEAGKHKVRHLIYPVPNPKFPFLGVHFTRMTDGSTECGPNAVFTFKREGYNKTDFDLNDTIDALSYAGTWKLFYKHWRFGLDEYRRAFSKKLFLKRLQRLIPSLTMDDIIPGRAGVRAMALNSDGEMIDDFKIVNGHRSIHVLNAPSPAATAGLAIGEAICDMAVKQFALN